MATALVQGPAGPEQGSNAWGGQAFGSGCFGPAACSSNALGAPAGATSLQQHLPRRYTGSGGMADGGPSSGAVCSAPPPAAALAAQQQQQQQRPTLRRPRNRGCQHCVGCIGVRRYCPSAAALVQARRGGYAAPQDTSEEWWPSGLSTPTIYFQLRRRQLHIQYKTSATAAASVKLWRPTSATHNMPSALLARRRLRPLGLLIPTTFTNVQQSDSRVQLIGIKNAPAWARTGPQSVASASAASPDSISISTATAAADKQLEMLLCCSDDLPLLRRGGHPPQPRPKAEPLRGLVDACVEAGVAGSEHSLAVHLLQRVQRDGYVAGSPAKRSRLDVVAQADSSQAAAHSMLHRPSPFAQPAAQAEPQQSDGAWWLKQEPQAPPVPQAPATQQAAQQHTEEQPEEQRWWLHTQQQPPPPQQQQTQVQQCGNPFPLAATPEGAAGMLAPAHSFGSGRSSLCLSSSMSIGSDGLPALQPYGSQPLHSATSVLSAHAPMSLPTYCTMCPAMASATHALAPPHQQSIQDQQLTLQFQHQQQYQPMQLQQPMQQYQRMQSQQHPQEYLQRQHAIKAERAYPVVIDLPAHKQAGEEQGVAAALSSLLRLLKRKAG